MVNKLTFVFRYTLQTIFTREFALKTLKEIINEYDFVVQCISIQ